MLILKLAFRNIVGAGLRTWLNVFVLSIAFVAIVWMQGFIKGMSEHTMNDMIDKELGGGQFWHRAYDPYDPLTLEEAHAPLSAPLQALVNRGQAAAVLVTLGAVYPQGRVMSALIKGIDPKQQVVNLPTQVLESDNHRIIPALIGGAHGQTDQTQTRR